MPLNTPLCRELSCIWVPLSKDYFGCGVRTFICASLCHFVVSFIYLFVAPQMCHLIDPVLCFSVAILICYDRKGKVSQARLVSPYWNCRELCCDIIFFDTIRAKGDNIGISLYSRILSSVALFWKKVVTVSITLVDTSFAVFIWTALASTICATLMDPLLCRVRCFAQSKKPWDRSRV